MDEPLAKRPARHTVDDERLERLNAFRAQLPYLSQAALAKILQLAQTTELPDLVHRKYIRIGRDNITHKKTPYGTIHQRRDVPLAAGGSTQLEFQHPLAMLHELCCSTTCFAELVQRTYDRAPSTIVSPWTLVIYNDEVNKSKETFFHEQGIVDYLGKVVKERNARPIHESPFTLRKEDDFRMELTLQWTESTDEHVRSYVNGIPTGSGGTHENGCRGAINKAVRNYVDTHSLTPRGVKLTLEDIREGMIVILSVFIEEPQFQGQTKDRLNNPDVQSVVEAAIRPALEQWMNNNRSVADSIVARIIAAARARAASRAASAAVSRKGGSKRTMLPGKLSDCVSGGKGDSEIFIVEGDSAGGSAKQGRNRNYQAILPLRGKVLNTESATLKKILENKEIQDLVAALGCGIGANLNLADLRYERVILLADADSDGHHITTLLLTFFYRHMPALIAAGRLYIGVPPLYRIDLGKETFWAADEAAREEVLEQYTGRAKPEITRFKGLGEMMPKVLWDTTLNPEKRRIQKVEIDDQLETDRIISDLMGRDASARFRFIMDRAEDAEAIDV